MLEASGRRLKAACLDLDGTLVDSIPLVYQAYCDFLEEHGYKGTREEFNRLNGPSLFEIAKFLGEKYGFPVSQEELVRSYLSRIQEVYHKAPLFPGVLEFLSYAKEAGLLLALVTSSTKKLVKKFLKHHTLESFFSVVSTGDEVRRAKPNPDIYHKTLEKLHLFSGDVLSVEDSLNGVSASLNAGIFTIWISHGEEGVDVPKDRVKVVKDWFQMRSDLERRLLL